ncbi:MAG TPA: pyridoxal kinase PdxY [Stellaceae bacterium]|nr:pyridoxal kinase PdxY [Stellaceae bacterium]
MSAPTGILSIQSAVSYGHVGNSAAVFPLQRLGFEVWPVNTLQFSNHPGYGAWRGRIFEPALIADLVEGMVERGALAACAGLLSGYLGDPATGEIVRRTATRLKAVNPAALWCCDPVMGDSGSGLYVRPGIPEFFRERAMPAADIVTPNRFELEQLTGCSIDSLAGALAAADRLRAMGPLVILVTSLERGDAVEMLALDDQSAWVVVTPRLPIEVNGAGDAAAALFLGHFLKTRNVEASLGATASAIFAVIEVTRRAGARELQLIAAQDEIVAPTRRFTPLRLR